jgi:hypothetical protein
MRDVLAGAFKFWGSPLAFGSLRGNLRVSPLACGSLRGKWGFVLRS